MDARLGNLWGRRSLPMVRLLARTHGANPPSTGRDFTSPSIGRIFILNGAVIGVAGTVLGNLLGLGGCWLLARYQFVELPKDVFLVTTLPVRVDPVNFVVVAAVSVAICVVAALSPARRAASLVPVEVIRYE